MMQIKRDFELVFDPQDYIDMHGEQFSRLLDRPGIRDDFEYVMVEDVEVFEPAACYEAFTIKNCLHERLELEGGMRIGGGPVMEVLRGAEQLVAAVCAVGAGVDERIKEYQLEKEHFKALILDEVASWAVDQLRQGLYHQLQAEMQAKSWHTSSMLSPGESAWTVDDQKVIFQLLDTSQIGVSLNDSCLMLPLKSLSMIMGIGRQEMGVEGLSNCDFCSIKEKCRYYELRILAQD
jgi:hypothetical protein